MVEKPYPFFMVKDDQYLDLKPVMTWGSPILRHPQMMG